MHVAHGAKHDGVGTRRDEGCLTLQRSQINLCASIPTMTIKKKLKTQNSKDKQEVPTSARSASMLVSCVGLPSTERAACAR